MNQSKEDRIKLLRAEHPRKKSTGRAKRGRPVLLTLDDIYKALEKRRYSLVELSEFFSVSLSTVKNLLIKDKGSYRWLRLWKNRELGDTGDVDGMEFAEAVDEASVNSKPKPEVGVSSGSGSLHELVVPEGHRMERQLKIDPKTGEVTVEHHSVSEQEIQNRERSMHASWEAEQENYHQSGPLDWE